MSNPAPNIESYSSRGRTLWSWECNGGPGCGGGASHDGFTSHTEALDAWRAHVRREHK